MQERLAERDCELNPSPQSWILTSVSVDRSPHSYLLTSAMVRLPVHTAKMCGTEPVRYVTLHLRDRRRAPLLRHRKRSEITVPMCEQRPYPVWFSCRRKSCQPLTIRKTGVINSHNRCCFSLRLAVIMLRYFYSAIRYGHIQKYPLLTTKPN